MWPTQGQKKKSIPRRGDLILYLSTCRLVPDCGDLDLGGTGSNVGLALTSVTTVTMELGCGCGRGQEELSLTKAVGLES